MEQKSNAFLEKEKIGTLMKKYSVPCIISLLVAALYNIVDQIFIANADYLGSYGNAANTVVFPLTVLALAIAVMIGDGACAFVSISLGANNRDNAHRSIGNAIVLCLGSSFVLTAVYLLASEPILSFFGGKVNAETYAFAGEYFFWIALGITVTLHLCSINLTPCSKHLVTVFDRLCRPKQYDALLRFRPEDAHLAFHRADIDRRQIHAANHLCSNQNLRLVECGDLGG